MARKRQGPKHSSGLFVASKREIADSLLAQLAAAGEAPQEESEEEALVAEAEADEPSDEEAQLPAAASDGQRPKKRRRPASLEAVGGPAAAASGVSAGKAGAARLAAWAESAPKLERWISSRGGGLEPMLEETKGKIVRLQDYFPRDVADATLAVLEGLPESAWELSEQGGEADAARHRFWSADVAEVPELSPLRSVFWRLLKTFRGEPTLPIFSAGRYGASDYIGRHDDRAHVPFFNDDNLYSRTVASIWYLTKDWSADEGGALVDLEAPKDAADGTLVPIYNSLAVFEVPHMHSVTAVTAGRYRYSIFGWWHQAGRRYELPGGGPAMGSRGQASRPAKKKAKCLPAAAETTATAAEAAAPAPTTGQADEAARPTSRKGKRRRAAALAAPAASGDPGREGEV